MIFDLAALLERSRELNSVSRPPWFRYFLTSLLQYFISSKNGFALSAANGGVCEKGVPSSGEKLVVAENQLSSAGGASGGPWRRIIPCPLGRACVTA
jgi:hypothetical protein